MCTHLCTVNNVEAAVYTGCTSTQNASRNMHRLQTAVAVRSVHAIIPQILAQNLVRIYLQTLLTESAEITSVKFQKCVWPLKSCGP